MINVILPPQSFTCKRNIFIDALLGYTEYTNCTTEHVVTEDLEQYKPSDDEKSLAREFHTNGYAQHVCRLKCVDNALLYVLSKVFMHVNEEGQNVLITYSMPFAFSSHGQDTIDEGMRFITQNESWLALMPSMLDRQKAVLPSPTQEICANIEERYPSPSPMSASPPSASPPSLSISELFDSL